LSTIRNAAEARPEVACEIDQLKTALESNRIIATAIGIVMERHQIDREQAFDFLVRDSSHRNIKLRVVAEELVNATEKRGCQRKGAEGAAMGDRDDQLVSWWMALSREDRAHARACASRGRGDTRLAASLQTAGLGLVSDRWHRVTENWARYIPDDVLAFLRSRVE
jgi:hypothetical protein